MKSVQTKTTPFQRHLHTAGKVIGLAHTAYNVGKGLYSFYRAVAPIATTAVLLLL